MQGICIIIKKVNHQNNQVNVLNGKMQTNLKQWKQKTVNRKLKTDNRKWKTEAKQTINRKKEKNVKKTNLEQYKNVEI